MDVSFQLTAGPLHLDRRRKVIKAAEYQVWLDAEALIAEGRRQADELRNTAQAAYEAEKQRGYEEGLRQGQAKASEQMFDTVSRTLNYLEQIEGGMVEVVTAAVEKIIGRIGDADLVVGAVKQALALVRDAQKVILRVSPADVEAVRGRVQEILTPYPTLNVLEVVPDRQLGRGGAVLETEIGVIDASIDVQLDALETALQRSLGAGRKAAA